MKFKGLVSLLSSVLIFLYSRKTRRAWIVDVRSHEDDDSISDTLQMKLTYDVRPIIGRIRVILYVKSCTIKWCAINKYKNFIKWSENIIRSRSPSCKSMILPSATHVITWRFLQLKWIRNTKIRQSWLVSKWSCSSQVLSLLFDLIWLVNLDLRYRHYNSSYILWV